MTAVALAARLVARRGRLQVEIERELAAAGFGTEEVARALVVLRQRTLWSPDRALRAEVQRLSRTSARVRIKESLVERGSEASEVDAILDEELAADHDQRLGLRLYKLTDTPGRYARRLARAGIEPDLVAALIESCFPTL